MHNDVRRETIKARDITFNQSGEELGALDKIVRKGIVISAVNHDDPAKNCSLNSIATEFTRTGLLLLLLDDALNLLKRFARNRLT
mmetsp:Transcript_6278/g.16007  ORF Transcript_6278/g.16007 Transcript_6278/m.16007 type:complete len:85 (-) Transcript_6278:829-1083(-)